MQSPPAPLLHASTFRRQPVVLALIAIVAAVLMGPVPAMADPAMPNLTFTVNSTNDPGLGVCDLLECTLREAITAANALPGTDTIDFDIPGSPPFTIAATSDFPAITSPVVIDGTTQAGFSGSPIIEVSGASASSFYSMFLVNPGGSGSTIRGLVVNQVSTSAIRMDSSNNNVIAGNYIGTDVTGTLDLGNGNGVVVDLGNNNTIGGTTPADRNVISGNSGEGVRIDQAATGGNVVQGNYIGTDVTGTAPLGNSKGVTVLSRGTTVGGTSPGARNVISGNNPNVEIVFSFAFDNVVQGNFIGTDATGTAALGGGGGITIFAGAHDNVVGGTTEAARNIISGNAGEGIRIQSPGTTNNKVQGNYIGTDVTGTAPLGNTASGVGIFDADGNEVGGTAPGAGNVISDNQFGVDLQFGSTGNLIQGNLIGTDATGLADLGNDVGGFLVANASNNTIGGVGPGVANVIAFNGGPGVRAEALPSDTGNEIRGNSIFSNAALGIDLGNDGVTPNDDGTGDADTGANMLQNFPELTGVTSGGGSIIIDGTLDSAPNTSFDLEFFSSPSCDGSGFGEGATLLGTSSVTTDGAGMAAFSESFPGSLLPTDAVTATATDPSGNTSEFSACAFPTAPPVSADLSLTETDQIDNPDPVTEGLDVRYLVTVTNLGPAQATGVTVTDTLPLGTTFVEATPSQGTCDPPAGGSITCDLGALDGGASATVEVVVQSPFAPGSITNSATVSANEDDPVTGNNSSSETTTVQARFGDEAHGWVPSSGGHRVLRTGTRPTPADTSVTRVIAPLGVEGEIHVVDGAIDPENCPAGYTCFGQQADIIAPTAPGNPYRFFFAYDESVVPPGPDSGLVVLEGGVEVPRCATPGSLGPDPCISAFRRLMGDIRFRVLSSTDGEWVGARR